MSHTMLQSNLVFRCFQYLRRQPGLFRNRSLPTTAIGYPYHIVSIIHSQQDNTIRQLKTTGQTHAKPDDRR
jgi:hypothetical protein